MTLATKASGNEKQAFGVNASCNKTDIGTRASMVEVALVCEGDDNVYGSEVSLVCDGDDNAYGSEVATYNCSVGEGEHRGLKSFEESTEDDDMASIGKYEDVLTPSLHRHAKC